MVVKVSHVLVVFFCMLRRPPKYTRTDPLFPDTPPCRSIYPIDIEDVLRRQPAVEECAVVGVHHPDWGETPVAFVVPASGVVVQTQELREAANREMGRQQRISEIRLIDKIPSKTLGKVMKHKLVESYCVSSADRKSTRLNSSHKGADRMP